MPRFNALSWIPTLKAIWGPKGQQVMIPTPDQPNLQVLRLGAQHHSRS